MNDNNTARVRLDKWLWAARFFKTRSLAADAIDGGKVSVNGDGVKRAKQIQHGDEVSVRQPPFEHIVRVRGLSERRGPASVASTLYEETPASLAARSALAAQMRAIGPSAFQGRPNKKDRRDIDRLRDRR